MNCEHPTRTQRTAWRDYSPRRPGILQAKLIQEERCESCQQTWISPTGGIRAVRERAETISTSVDPLRHTETDRRVLKTLLGAAKRTDEEVLANVGAWRSKLAADLGFGRLEEELTRLLEDGLLIVERGRTPRRSDQLICVRWELKQYEALCAQLGVQRLHENPLGVELQAAIERHRNHPQLGILVTFWENQLSQLNGSVQRIQGKKGDTTWLTSRSKRYPLVIRATFELASNRSEGVFRSGPEIAASLNITPAQLRAESDVLEAITGEPLESYGVGGRAENIEFGAGVTTVQAEGTSKSIENGLTVTSERILFVQTREAFRALVCADPPGVLPIHSPGRLTPLLSFLARKLAATATEVLVWCEMEPAGIEIAESILSILPPEKSHLFLMDYETHVTSSARQKLSAARVQRAQRMMETEDAASWASPLVSAIVREREFMSLTHRSWECKPAIANSFPLRITRTFAD